ncbi:hypothetical protein K490DRAFT_50804 [Saccharata proteae CBS 121410]|uniref:Uncharacterized protein n=1 Tax=Saccharata proteae CBS 121410 TaxID=1314787 RepID=A0A9P4HPV5_9PEZI|nr:hypothetical protein K490DRAFT_50804 [Saccharata proteae CBS 121410]
MPQTPRTLEDPLSNLSVKELDTLFQYQIGLRNYKALNQFSFYIAGITDSERRSRKTHLSLCKAGVLFPTSSAVITGNITSNFRSQQQHLPSYARRKLVNMLFFWEEELVRWKLLEGEEGEVTVVLSEERSSGGECVGHLEKRLKEIKGLMRLKPSLRDLEAGNSDEPPDYESAIEQQPMIGERSAA